MAFNHLTTLAMIAGLALAAGAAQAQEAAKKPHVPLEKTIGQAKAAGPVPSLAVINSQGAKLEGNTLTLTGVSANSIVFADRPVRAAGHVPTDQFIAQWDQGKDSFAKDPPNATISILGGDNVSDAVVTLKSAKLEGGNLVFDVAVLEGNLEGVTGPAALFIDHFGWGGGGYGWHGGYWRPRGAFYAGAMVGAAVGAAAASPYYQPYPYYPPRCGYYPYPPCY